MDDAKIDKLELEELDASQTKDAPVASRNLDAVRDVEVRLTAVLGGTTISLGEMFELRENSVLTLDALVDQPVDLLLNQQVVARGALVVVDDKFAVQISEIPESDVS